MPDDQPLPGEAEGLAAADFVIVARARVRIPRAGDWTIGVHTDDGFALRFIGAPFDSVHGNGLRDDTFPEYMAYLTETGNSSTRGILRNLAAGEYGIEMIAFQRVGGAQYEVYAAEGAFAEDTDTDQWALIGGAGGLELVAEPVTFEIERIVKVGGRVTLDFRSPNPNGPHQVFRSTDLKTWSVVSGVEFTPIGAQTVRATVGVEGDAAGFYRLRR